MYRAAAAAVMYCAIAVVQASAAAAVHCTVLLLWYELVLLLLLLCCCCCCCCCAAYHAAAVLLLCTRLHSLQGLRPNSWPRRSVDCRRMARSHTRRQPHVHPRRSLQLRPCLALSPASRQRHSGSDHLRRHWHCEYAIAVLCGGATECED